MAGYIGQLGRMVKLLWPTPVKVTNPTRYAVQSAPARRWAFVTSPASARRREWSLEVTGTNAETAELAQLVAGAFGDGPWVFVPDEATVTNVLTPAESMLSGVANSGAVDGVGGAGARSHTGGGLITIAEACPCIPGEPVTVTVDMAGTSGVLAVQPVNSAGQPVGAAVTARPAGELMERVSVVIPALPLGACAVKIQTRDSTAVTRPQVTWTDGPVPWDMGAGAASVIIEEAQTTYTSYEFHMREMWRTLSLTIREVG